MGASAGRKLELAEVMAEQVTAASSERRGGDPPVCERKREERVADVAIGATWTSDVAENRGGFGLGVYFARFR